MPKRPKTKIQAPAVPVQPQVIKDLKQDLKQVGHGAAILYGVVGILLLGAQPAAIKALSDPTRLSHEAVSFYLDVFKQAAPLTLAVALVGISWAWALRQPGFDFSGVCLLLAVSALILGVSTGLGNWLGAGQHVDGQQLVGSLPLGLDLLINSLYSYYRAYQGTLFGSSLLVGGYLAVVWVWKVEKAIRPTSSGAGNPSKADGETRAA